MQALIDISNKLKSLDLEAVALASVIDHEAEALDMITEGQLMEGVDGKGNALKAYRSPLYADFKATLNPKGVTDLKLDGDFHDGFMFKNKSWPIEVFSSDEKAEMLADKYGDAIFDLSEDHADKLSKDYVLGDILSAFKRALE